jgi:hypothetical protein
MLVTLKSTQALRGHAERHGKRLQAQAFGRPVRLDIRALVVPLLKAGTQAENHHCRPVRCNPHADPPPHSVPNVSSFSIFFFLFLFLSFVLFPFSLSLLFYFLLCSIILVESI